MKPKDIAKLQKAAREKRKAPGDTSVQPKRLQTKALGDPLVPAFSKGWPFEPSIHIEVLARNRPSPFLSSNGFISPWFSLQILL